MSSNKFTPKTKAEIEALSSDGLLARIYDMMDIIERHKDSFQSVFLVYNTTLEMMHVSAEALIGAQEDYADTATIEKLTAEYRQAKCDYDIAVHRRGELAIEGVLIREELDFIKSIKIDADMDRNIELSLNDLTKEGFVSELLSIKEVSVDKPISSKE